MGIQNSVSQWAGALSLLVCAGVCLFHAADSSAAEGWGSVAAKFKFKGTPPEPQAFKVTGDCVRHTPMDDSLVVGATGGVANVVVVLMPERGQKVPVHPDRVKELSKSVSLDTVECRFEPHIAVMTAGQTLTVRNLDPFSHNIKPDFFRNPAWGNLIPAGRESGVKVVIDRSEPLPVRLTCNIHPFMSGWLVVAETPYAALSDSDGNVAIELVPPGKWTFLLWHEKQGYVKGPALKRGRMTATIAADKVTDLGTFEFQ